MPYFDHAAAVEAMDRALNRSLALDILVEALGSPGIVVDEGIARNTPCRCVDSICFSKGIVGALSKAQQEWACNPRAELKSPALRQRVERFREAASTCKTRLEQNVPTDGSRRLEFWIECMGQELRGRGVEL